MKTEEIKTWRDRITTPTTNQKNLFMSMQAEIDELRAKLAELEAQPHSATLHDDGYWTWNGSPPYESQYAGWRLKVYLAAGAAPVQLWPKEVQPDGSINDVDPADMAAAPVPQTNTLSWSGFNIHGNDSSIKEVQRLVERCASLEQYLKAAQRREQL